MGFMLGSFLLGWRAGPAELPVTDTRHPSPARSKRRARATKKRPSSEWGRGLNGNAAETEGEEESPLSSSGSDGGVYSRPLRSGRSLVGAQDAVVRVTLSGGEAGFADQLARLVDGRLHDVPGGLVDILLEQGAAEVIGTE